MSAKYVSLAVRHGREEDEEQTGYIAMEKRNVLRNHPPPQGRRARPSSWMNAEADAGASAVRKKITLALVAAMRLAYSCAGYLEFSGV